MIVRRKGTERHTFRIIRLVLWESSHHERNANTRKCRLRGYNYLLNLHRLRQPSQEQCVSTPSVIVELISIHWLFLLARSDHYLWIELSYTHHEDYSRSGADSILCDVHVSGRPNGELADIGVERTTRTRRTRTTIATDHIRPWDPVFPNRFRGLPVIVMPARAARPYLPRASGLNAWQPRCPSSSGG